MLLLVALLVASPAWGQPAMSREAKTHYDAGMDAFARKDYQAAIRAFEAGYAIDPRREFLFAQAQAERLSGDCPSALALYRRFLETDPPPQQVEATRLGERRCEDSQAARGVAAEPLSLPINAAAPPSPRPTALLATPPPPHAWYRDRPGAALAAGGTVGIGVGAGFLWAALSARTEAKRGEEYRAYERGMDIFAHRRTVALVALVSGGVLIASAALRYALVWRQGGGGGAVAPTF